MIMYVQCAYTLIRAVKKGEYSIRLIFTFDSVLTVSLVKAACFTLMSCRRSLSGFPVPK